MFARFLPSETHVNTVRLMPLALLLSLFMALISVGVLWHCSLKYGVDFTGGLSVQAEMPAGTSAAHMKKLLRDNGMDDALVDIWGAENQHVQMRFPHAPEGAEEALQSHNAFLKTLLTQEDRDAHIVKSEYVSTELSRDFYRKGVLALGLTLCVILFYIAVRFSFRFACVTVMALMFDVLFIAALFALLQKEVTLAVLAALLTVVGYSLNDTLVMLARVRHNAQKFHDASFRDVLNVSVNETLVRTLLMSFTTLCAFVALYVWGGDAINGFAFTLISGVIVGTYSSLAVALPLVLFTTRYYGKKTR